MSDSRKEIRICFIGESFVNGTGDPEFLGWTGRVCRNAESKGYAITHYNLGVRAETSRYLKYRWRSEVSYRLSPDYDGRVVFSFGVNDSGWAGKKQLYPVLMISPPPCGDIDQEKRNQIIANLSQEFALVCKELEVPYLDVFSSLLKSPIWLTEAKANDGAHPKADGYAEFAAIVQNWEGWLNWFTPE